MTAPNQNPLIWVLTDDRPGNAGQALGVAEALDLPFVQKPVRYTSLGKLPNVVRGSTLIGVTEDSIAQLVAPWPKVVIAAGRRTAPVARWIKKVSQQSVHLVQIMNPGVAGAGDFALIAIPRHDCAREGGDLANVMRITGAPHRFSHTRLADEARVWGPKLSHLPRPFVAVLVGGATRQRPFAPALARDLGARVNAMAKQLGGCVLLTTSRRTGPEAEVALRAAIDAPNAMYLWGQEAVLAETGKPNPYGGFLALADVVVVTGDSVSMCSEACANPNAVYIYAPEGMAAPKHQRLHAQLYAGGYAKAIGDDLGPFQHPALNAAAEIAQRVRALIDRPEPPLQLGRT
jgi:uncharacterized protein